MAILVKCLKKAGTTFNAGEIVQFDERNPPNFLRGDGSALLYLRQNAQTQDGSWRVLTRAEVDAFQAERPNLDLSQVIGAEKAFAWPADWVPPILRTVEAFSAPAAGEGATEETGEPLSRRGPVSKK